MVSGYYGTGRAADREEAGEEYGPPRLTLPAAGDTFPPFLRGGSAIDPKTPTDRPPLRYRRLPSWLPPLLWAGVILGASSVSDLQTSPGGIAIRDKLAHFGEYFIFGWLVARSFEGLGWGGGRHFLWTLLFGVLLGCADEFYQGFVPGREQDILDILADTLGTAAGWYFSREDEGVGEAHGSARNP